MFPLTDTAGSKTCSPAVSYNIFNNETCFLCIIFFNCSVVNRRPI